MAIQIQTHLMTMQDMAYKDFQSKLIPNVDPDTIIGIRTPALRKFAKEIKATPEASAFLQALPHQYYEENNLHAFLIEQIPDFDTCISSLEMFLPHIDNWATCDGISPKVFKKHLPDLLTYIRQWLCSSHTYTIRFAIVMLMKFYLDEAFTPELPALAAQVHSEEYYVNMAIAWYFATALAKQYHQILPYIEEQRLDVWTHNKAIQKAIESYRITDEQKAYLKSLKKK